MRVSPQSCCTQSTQLYGVTPLHPKLALMQPKQTWQHVEKPLTTGAAYKVQKAHMNPALKTRLIDVECYNNGLSRASTHAPDDASPCLLRPLIPCSGGPPLIEWGDTLINIFCNLNCPQGPDPESQRIARKNPGDLTQNPGRFLPGSWACRGGEGTRIPWGTAASNWGPEALKTHEIAGGIYTVLRNVAIGYTVGFQQCHHSEHNFEEELLQAVTGILATGICTTAAQDMKLLQIRVITSKLREAILPKQFGAYPFSAER